MKKVLSVLLISAMTLCILALPASARSTLDDAAQGYYIIGTMNDRQIRKDYKINSYDGGQTYRFPLYMTPDDSFRIVYSSDGITPDDGRYYPAGEGTAFNQESPIINESGTYVFAFRPACDGGRGYVDTGMIYHASQREVWYYDCIICEGYEPANKCYLHGDEPATEPGYYIVGNMTDLKLKKYYKVINRYGHHYESEYPITLHRGDTFKIAYSEDGESITRLYPEGEGNAYNEDVTRIYYDGQELLVSFYPNADADENELCDYSGKGAHYGMISVFDSSMWDCLEPLEIPAKPRTDGAYRDALIAAYPDIDEAYLDYEEMYVHRDDHGDAEWVLVWASNYEYEGGYFYTVIADRLFYQYGYRGNPFLTHFGIYDVKRDRFYDPALGGSDGFKSENYVDFDRVINEYATLEYNSRGRLLGDIDRDDEISVLDVTLFQRCEANIIGWPQDDAFMLYDFITTYAPVTYYYSDFNCDCERDILDATCMQRYLAGMDYPKYR